MKGRTLRPRPFDNKKKLPVVHDAAGLDLNDSTVARSIAKRNSELEKNNDKVVTVANKSGEELVPIPGWREVVCYAQLYPNDFECSDDMNAEYLTSGKVPLPTENVYVEYAADSEDEEWLELVNSEGQDRLSPANFEKLVWKLELANAMFTQHTLRKAGALLLERKTKSSSGFVHYLSKANAIKLLTKHEGFDPVVIERVYDYWLRKRRCRKEPLLRTLQPKTPANDRDPDHTFREREKMKRPNLRRRRQVNRGDNVEEKLLEIKDEMGHACNILRSMINRESIKAHIVNIYVAQKRSLFNKLRQMEPSHPCQSRDIQKEQLKKENYLKKDDASYRSKICRQLLQNVFRGDLRMMFASPRGMEGEGGCETAIPKRLKKAQKRRQKWISYLVQDRNWHAWHDKTWMQKTYLMLKKRSLVSDVTAYVHKKETWDKWMAFVKLTRDRRIRRLFDQRRQLTGKFEKSKRSKIGEKMIPASSPSDPFRQMIQKATLEHESSEIQEEMKGVENSVVVWAKKQGITPPEKPQVSKTVRVPGPFEVPHQGFQCLPPQLKERYLEAEKDVLQPPTAVIEKMKTHKKRRRSIRRYSTAMDRSEAVLEMEKERSRQLKKEEKKKKMQKLKRSVLERDAVELNTRLEKLCTHLLQKTKSPTGDIQSPPLQLPSSSGGVSDGTAMGIPKSALRLSVQDVPSLSLMEGTYDETRRTLLLYLKARIAVAKEDIRNGATGNIMALRRWMACFASVKTAKEPDIRQLTHIIDQCTTQRHDTTAFTTNHPILDSCNADMKNPTVEGVVESTKDRTSQKTSKYVSVKSVGHRLSQHEVGKKAKLVKRRHRRLILELRWNGRTKTIDLEPGSHTQFRPFKEDAAELDTDRLRHYLEDTEALPITTEPERGPEMDEGMMDIEESVSTNWNGICSRDGPVAHVPVQSHRLITTSSAPLLVTDDDRAKSKGQKLTVGMAASRRLLKGKGVSLPLLQRRRKLRRAILQPTLPRNIKCSALPRTKLRKIKALSRVTRKVPSRPERKPMFSYVFHLNKTASTDKSPVNARFPSGIPDALVTSGVVRLGRGNRIWIDRVDPFNMKPVSFSSTSTPPTIDKLRPVLKKVLEVDERKMERLNERTRERRSHFKQEAEKQTLQATSEVPSIDRRRNFLPHWMSHQDARTNTPRDDGSDGTADIKKEAQRLHGVALEMGVELPIGQLQMAVRDSRDRLCDVHVKPEAEGNVGPIVYSKVISCREASAKGSLRQEEWRASMYEPSTTQRILRTESGSIVNVNYLSSIAPRKPRTSMDARTNSQRSRS